MNKYRNKPTEVDGIRFASLHEAKRYQALRLMTRAGEITDLELQPKYWLKCGDKDVKYASGRRASYIADFRYYDKGLGREVVEDAKGMDTPVSRLKRAFVEAQYGVKVKLV